MNVLNKLKKPVFYFSLVFIFMIFINFRDIPNKYALIGAVCFCLFYAFEQKKVYLDSSIILICIVMLLYAKLRGFDTSSMIMHVALPSVFQLFGKTLMADLTLKKEKEWYILLSIFAFLVGFSGHGLLNGYVFCTEGFIIPNIRYWYDFWTRSFLPGTQHSIYVLPMLAVLWPAAIYLKKYKVPCVAMMSVGIFFLYYSIDSLSRLPILIFAITTVWEISLFVALNKDNKKVMHYTKIVFIAGVTVAVLVAILVLINWNTVSQITFVTNLGKDGGLLNNVRFIAQRSVLIQLFAYPMGGMPVEGLNMAHNVWLDMALDTGIIPFFLFVVYTILTVIELVKLLRSQACPELKYLLSGIYISFVLYYSMEPALNANIQYMIPWVFNNGLISGVNKNESIQS